MTETWKSVPRHPGYDVSDHGQVRSYHTRQGAPGGQWRVAKTPQKILQPSPDRRGYLGVCLRTKGKTHRIRVAYLVMAAFVGPRPEGMWVCYESHDFKNNHVDNLRYDTPMGAMAALSDEQRQARGIHKLTNEQVVIIRTRYATEKRLTQQELAAEYNVSQTAIDRVCSGASYLYLDGPLTRNKFQPRVSNQIAQTILLRLNYDTARNLAREYGIHESTISRWKTGKNRKGLTARKGE